MDVRLGKQISKLIESYRAGRRPLLMRKNGEPFRDKQGDPIVVRESCVLPALRGHVMMEAARLAGQKVKKRFRISTAITKGGFYEAAVASAHAPVQRGPKIHEGGKFLGWFGPNGEALGNVGMEQPGSTTLPGGDEEREVAPPGREKQVKALKKKPGVKNPFAVAWASKNKAKAKTADVPKDEDITDATDAFHDDLDRKKSLQKMMKGKNEDFAGTDHQFPTPVDAWRTSEAERTFNRRYTEATGMSDNLTRDPTPTMPEALGEDGKQDKSSPAVNYRYSQSPQVMCATCKHFDETSEEEFGGSCELVAGVIRGVDVCNLWEAIEKNPAVMEARRAFRKRYDA